MKIDLDILFRLYLFEVTVTIINDLFYLGCNAIILTHLLTGEIFFLQTNFFQNIKISLYIYHYSYLLSMICIYYINYLFSLICLYGISLIGVSYPNIFLIVLITIYHMILRHL